MKRIFYSFLFLLAINLFPAKAGIAGDLSFSLIKTKENACSSAVPGQAGEQLGDLSYIQKAEEMLRLVWQNYRVHEYGLFSEHYPSSYKPD